MMASSRPGDELAASRAGVAMRRAGADPRLAETEPERVKPNPSRAARNPGPGREEPRAGPHAEPEPGRTEPEPGRPEPRAGPRGTGAGRAEREPGRAEPRAAPHAEPEPGRTEPRGGPHGTPRRAARNRTRYVGAWNSAVSRPTVTVMSARMSGSVFVVMVTSKTFSRNAIVAGNRSSAPL